MNKVIECLTNHKSIRKFKSEVIEPDKMETILHAGTRAATGGNLQFYSFIVVDDDAKKAELNRAIESKLIETSNAPAVIIALVDLHRARRWLTLHSDRPVVVNRPYNFFMGIWDALIALQNVVVAAESLGLGTCYIGSAVEMNIHEIFGAPEFVFPAGMIVLGYPDHSPELSKRLPLDAVVHKNQYRLPTDDDLKTWYKWRDDVWNIVSEQHKEKLARQNIHGIAQALAVQKFSDEIVNKRSKGIIENFARSKFELTS